MGVTSYQPVYALTLYNSELIAGGQFTTAGGDVSRYWARWGPVGPTITQQPSNQVACPGDTVTFSVTASGTGAMTYQWRRNGVILTDGPRVSGAATPTLTLRGVINAGPYDVIITDDCNSTVSQPVRIQPCTASVAAE